MRLILNYRKSESIMEGSHGLYKQKYFLLVSRDQMRLVMFESFPALEELEI